MSEQQFVDSFIARLNEGCSPWGKVKVSTEFFYQSGRTDILVLTEDGELIAFEAKLQRWKTAAHQAYRNTVFADRSYVLVPERTASLAYKSEHEFERRQVGLCSIVNETIAIFRPAEKIEPLNNCLRERAVAATA